MFSAYSHAMRIAKYMIHGNNILKNSESEEESKIGCGKDEAGTVL